MLRLSLPAALCALSSSALAATPLGLSSYTLGGIHGTPQPVAEETSAISYNWDAGTYFVVGDEGEHLVEMSATGALLGSYALTGFDDTEGVAYLGGGRVAIGEERIRTIVELDLSAATYGDTFAKSDGRSVALFPGTNVGNSGLEGISFDPVTGMFYGVKEKGPRAFYAITADFAAGTAAVTQPFNLQTTSFGASDYADLAVLRGIGSGAGAVFGDTILLLSQESSLLVQVTYAGVLVDSLSLASLAGRAEVSDNFEGVTVDALGNIYLVGEEPDSLVVLLRPQAVPEPATYAAVMGLVGLAGACLRRRLRR